MFLILLSACSGPQDQPVTGMYTVMALTGSNVTGFDRAAEVRKFIFPEDHGEHPGFRTEWWYFTGNIKTENGREFGYQFTIFRNAIKHTNTAGWTDNASSWKSGQIYMAHAALSDIETGRFYQDEQFSRGALGLAGTESDPFRVWLNGWSVSGEHNFCEDCFVVRISVTARDFRLQLQLNNTQPVVLHGKQGLSSKSPVPGNASYYYSYTRMQTHGLIGTGDESYSVNGESWYDHEWSTSALEQDQEGWDWFSIQLIDQTEIMLFRLRNSKDPGQDYYYGSLMYADGTLQTLDEKDFKIREDNTWESPVTGIVYPSAWTVTLPGSRLRITPKLPDQEINNSFVYWEGAVRVTGLSGNRNVSGHGYVELTGYQ